MNQLFVTYEIAKRLKYLQFNEQCFGVITPNDKIIIEDQWLFCTNDLFDESKNLAAPLWQQAIKFLYDETGDYVEYDPDNERMIRIMTEKLDELDKRFGANK